MDVDNPELFGAMATAVAYPATIPVYQCYLLIYNFDFLLAIPKLWIPLPFLVKNIMIIIEAFVGTTYLQYTLMMMTYRVRIKYQ